MKGIVKVGGKRLVVVALAVALLVGLSGCGGSDSRLVGTRDAYYMIVGEESTGVGKGEMRLDLTNKGTFTLTSLGEIAAGDWSYDDDTLSLDYGEGYVADMAVSFISDSEISTLSEDGTVLVSWRKR